MASRRHKLRLRRALKPPSLTRHLGGRIALALLVAAAAGLVYLDLTIRGKFEGERWALPAHVYSRPQEVVPGAPFSLPQFTRKLAQIGYRRAPEAQEGALAAGTFRVDQGAVTVRTRPWRWWNEEMPSQRFIVEFDGGRVGRVYHGAAAAGSATAAPPRLEPLLLGSISTGRHQDRTLVKLGRVPPRLVEALVAVEDRNFLRHPGLDFRGLARALWVNLRSGELTQGGSTLTQQLVKNLYLTKRRTLPRKLLEMPMALLLELHYDKDEILEAYLNEVYLGQAGNRAIHGFGLAARFYFGRPLIELELHEVALLVGLVKGPSLFNPLRHPERALARRNLVIRQLAELGLISAAEAGAARARPLSVIGKEAQAAGPAPAFLDLVKRQLRRHYDENALRREGLRIHTTLAPEIQSRAEAALDTVLAQLESARAMEAGSLQGAVVVVRASGEAGGEVLALAGGRGGMRGFNRALDALRPVGSLIKPVIYLNALSQPDRYTLATTLSDQPLRLLTEDGDVWQPRNYDKKLHGTPLLVTALARSYNLPAVRVGLDLGPAEVIETLELLGVRRPVKPYPSVLLGALPMTPLEVAQVYQVLAGGGRRTPLRSILNVTSGEQSPLARYLPGAEQVAAPGPAHLLRFALEESVRTGTARTLGRTFTKTAHLAGKTGTTDDYRDSWFAGFSGGLLAVVWVGRDDNKPTGLSGAGGAMRVWARLMHGLQSAAPAVRAPAAIETALIDPASGLRADRNCPGALTLPFLPGSAPTADAPCAAKPQPQKSRVPKWLRRIFGVE